MTIRRLTYRCANCSLSKLLIKPDLVGRFGSILKTSLLLCLMISLVACSEQDADQTSEPSAASISQIRLDCDQSGNELQLHMQQHVSLSKELQRAASKGVPLYFTLEFEVYKPHFLWFDDQILVQKKNWRIQYNSLLRQWSVFDGDESSIEFSLQGSLQHINSFKTWSVERANALEPDQQYVARLRLRLDTSLLPSTFQLNAFHNRSAWLLSSEWQNFDVQVSKIKPVF